MSLRMRMMIACGALLTLTPVGLTMAQSEADVLQAEKSKQSGQSPAGAKSGPSGSERSSGQSADAPKASGGNLGEDKSSTSGSTAPPKGNSGGAPGPKDGSRGGH